MKMLLILIICIFNFNTVILFCYQPLDSNYNKTINDSIMNCDMLHFFIQWEDGSITHRSSISFINKSTNTLIENELSSGAISLYPRSYRNIEDVHYSGLKDTLLKSNFPVYDSRVVANERILHIIIYENKKIIGDYTLKLSKYNDIIVGILKKNLSPEEWDGIIRLISSKVPY